jgi:hypothetical protein
MVTARTRAFGSAFPIAIFLTACIAVVAACASTSPPSEAPLTATRSPSAEPVATVAAPSPANGWIEPAAYTFKLESACGERALIGIFRVTVEDHRTVAFSGVDAAGIWFHGDPGSIPTLAAILAETADAKARNASRVDVTSDPLDGHPVDVSIDRIANGIDDESCYRISDYVVAAEVSPTK